MQKTPAPPQSLQYAKLYIIKFQLHTDVTVLGAAKENGSGLGLLLCK
ncbi:MAG: hypothetical protein ACJAUF_000734 [Bacteroidia bacterium]|jgi:hypothetical protein